MKRHEITSWDEGETGGWVVVSRMPDTSYYPRAETMLALPWRRLQEQFGFDVRNAIRIKRQA